MATSAAWARFNAFAVKSTVGNVRGEVTPFVLYPFVAEQTLRAAVVGQVVLPVDLCQLGQLRGLVVGARLLLLVHPSSQAFVVVRGCHVLRKTSAVQGRKKLGARASTLQHIPMLWCRAHRAVSFVHAEGITRKGVASPAPPLNVEAAPTLVDWYTQREAQCCNNFLTLLLHSFLFLP